MASPSSPAVRRSSRSRQKRTTIYDTAAIELEEKERLRAALEEEDIDSNASSERNNDKKKHDDVEDEDDESKGVPEGSDDEDEEMKDAPDDSEEVDEDSDDDDEQEEEEESYHPSSTRKGTPRNSLPNAKESFPAPVAVATAASKKGASKSGGNPPKKRAIQVKTVTPAKQKPGKAPQRLNNSINGGGNGERARIARALELLSKKVLSPEEQITNIKSGSKISLVAALLASYKPIPGIPSSEPSKGSASPFGKDPNTVYTPQLEGIARHWMQQNDANSMHIGLLNLLFRSVGGSLETTIPDGTDLEELEDEHWDDLVTNVVNVMRETDDDRTLLCADPPEEGKVGQVAYRHIYKEFWYLLGRVILSTSSMSNPTPSQTSGVSLMEDEEDNVSGTDDSRTEDEGGDSDSDEDELLSLNSKKKGPRQKKMRNPAKPKMNKGNKQSGSNVTTSSASTPFRERFVSNHFQVELVRDLINRLTELVSVGQPDLRAGGTIAIMQLSKACTERTVELETKIQVATRQYKAAVQQKSKSKMQALKNAMDAWKRHKAEVEEIVEGPVFQGVFIHRYRDANASIRKECMDALSKLSLIRPDIFLVDKYLKYFGWMTYDKKAPVRIAALEGLSAPFKAYDAQVKKQTSSSTSATPYVVDISAMQNVTLKFLDRIVDCTEDSQSVKVQEAAISLILAMLKEEFLDDWQDDMGWEQINLKALDVLTSLTVRRDALYFVLDQLPSFDVERGAQISEKKQSDQLTAIASWVANKLCDGPVPIDKINIELVDNIIHSLLEMPEHQDLVRHWPVMLSAVRTENPQQDGVSDRQAVATQRILLRMLATSAELERKKLALSKETLQTTNSRANKKRMKTDRDIEQSLDSLSVALMKNLPNLLSAFKADVMAMRDLTKLPATITSSVLSLPSRRTDFQNLVSALCQLFTHSTDEQVLHNIAGTLSQWVEGDHSRVSEVNMQLKRLSSGLQNRLMELFAESEPKPNKDQLKSQRRKRRATGHADSSSTESSFEIISTSATFDTEYSIAHMMARWKILLMECQAKFLFEKIEGHDLDDLDETEGLYNTISEAMGKRLLDRRPLDDRPTGDDGTKTVATVRTIWVDEDPNVHQVVSKGIDMALKVLLLLVANELGDTLEKLNDPPAKSSDQTVVKSYEIDVDDLLVVRMRDKLVKLLGLCFDQHVVEIEEVEITDEQHEFAASVQNAAGRVASDLRTLFPQGWSTAADPVRKVLALTGGPELSHLIGGFARWVQFQADAMETRNESASKKFVNDALLPLARVTAANSNDFYRREAALILANITGSGTYATQTVVSWARILKKTNPVRMLESHMACLRLAFENWVNTDPEDLQGSAPTEEELEAFEVSEKLHNQMFIDMEHTASKLSMTLGVGKLSDASLKKSLLGFMKEGVRYAFDGNEKEEDDLVLGSRLPFLNLLAKYSIWVKKEKSQLEQLTDYLLHKESELHHHPEYDEVHEDDLRALDELKRSLGISKRVSYAREATSTGADDYESAMATPSPSTAASANSSRRRSSTIGSQRSRLSVQSNLSPLYEEEISRDEDDREDSDNSPTPQKRRRLHRSSGRGDTSVGSSLTRGTFMTTTVDEEEHEQDMSD